MAGVYIHIPFCKQACHYCDFHFSTSLKNRTAMVSALAKEIELRKNELGDTVETIYFGGGTPSVLSQSEIDFLIGCVFANFSISERPEITLEANPDDLSDERIAELSQSKINRLSIGIQSFFDDDLQMMNRVHNASEAKHSLAKAVEHFENISIDLIYGIPGMSNEKWNANIDIALQFGVPHISSYALTVEPKTALEKFIRAGSISAPSDELASEHFKILVDTLQSSGFVHYELSNFSKPQFFSKNNSAYWLGKNYLGIGPSAHSYDRRSRSWNVSNNSIYLRSIEAGKLPSETEKLSKADRYNEYVMTGLRTIWGVSMERVEKEFGAETVEYLDMQSEVFLQQGLLEIENGILKTTEKGKFLADGIASDLFLINLDD